MGENRGVCCLIRWYTINLSQLSPFKETSVAWLLPLYYDFKLPSHIPLLNNRVLLLQGNDIHQIFSTFLYKPPNELPELDPELKRRELCILFFYSHFIQPVPTILNVPIGLLNVPIGLLNEVLIYFTSNIICFLLLPNGFLNQP